MYSGYLTVSSTKSLHYLYHTAHQEGEHLPLLIWFNGGPYCSSLDGWGEENGPCYLEGEKFVKNPYSWNKLANVLYIESPAGAGFSLINSNVESELSMDDDIAAHDNLIALIDFFNKFPSLKDKDFYISGESYAGIYIPMLALEILNYNNKVGDEKKINLKGILIGNGVADWKYDTTPAMIDFAFTHHLYSFEIRKEYIQVCFTEPDETKCNKIINSIMDLLEDINVYDMLQKCDGLKSDKYYNSNSYYFNYARWAFPNKTLQSKPKYFLQLLEEEKESVPCIDSSNIERYFNKPEVKSALHVKSSIKWELCNMEAYNRYRMLPKGSIYAYPYLLDKIRILIYSGDTDMAVPFNGNQAWIRNLKLPIISDWKPWRAYDLDGNVDMENIAGYRTIYQGLIFTTIKGTGHMVPQWKRKEAFYMVKQFLNNEDF
jgi:cathepsin A (carboxypeptidase C)